MSFQRRNLRTRPITTRPVGQPVNTNIQPPHDEGGTSTHQISTPTIGTGGAPRRTTFPPGGTSGIPAGGSTGAAGGSTGATSGTSKNTPFGPVDMNIQAGDKGVRSYATVSLKWEGVGNGKVNLSIERFTSNQGDNTREATWFAPESPIDISSNTQLGAPFFGHKRDDVAGIDIFAKRPDGLYTPLQPGTGITTSIRTFGAEHTNTETPSPGLPLPGFHDPALDRGNRLGGGFLKPLSVGGPVSERFFNKGVDISDLQVPLPRRNTILDTYQRPIIMVLFFALVSSVILKLYKEPEDANIKEYFKLKRHENRMKNAKAQAAKNKKVGEAEMEQAKRKIERAEKKEQSAGEISQVIDNELKKTVKAEAPKTSKEMLDSIETRQKLDRVMAGEDPNLGGTFKLGKIKIGEGAIKGGAQVIGTGIKEGVGVAKDITKATADMVGTVVKSGPAVAVPIVKEGAEVVKKPAEIFARGIVDAPKEIGKAVTAPGRKVVESLEKQAEAKRARELKATPTTSIKRIETGKPTEVTVKDDDVKLKQTIGDEPVETTKEEIEEKEEEEKEEEKEEEEEEEEVEEEEDPKIAELEEELRKSQAKRSVTIQDIERRKGIEEELKNLRATSRRPKTRKIRSGTTELEEEIEEEEETEKKKKPRFFDPKLEKEIGKLKRERVGISKKQVITDADVERVKEIDEDLETIRQKQPRTQRLIEKDFRLLGGEEEPIITSKEKSEIKAERIKKRKEKEERIQEKRRLREELKEQKKEERKKAKTEKRKKKEEKRKKKEDERVAKLIGDEQGVIELIDESEEEEIDEELEKEITREFSINNPTIQQKDRLNVLKQLENLSGEFISNNVKKDVIEKGKNQNVETIDDVEDIIDFVENKEDIELQDVKPNVKIGKSLAEEMLESTKIEMGLAKQEKPERKIEFIDPPAQQEEETEEEIEKRRTKRINLSKHANVITKIKQDPKYKFTKEDRKVFKNLGLDITQERRKAVKERNTEILETLVSDVEKNPRHKIIGTFPHIIKKEMDMSVPEFRNFVQREKKKRKKKEKKEKGKSKKGKKKLTKTEQLRKASTKRLKTIPKRGR